MKMKAWLGLLTILGCCQAGSSSCPPCALDEICNEATSTCDCNLNLYTRSAAPPTPMLECSAGHISLVLSRCQLEKDRYDYTALHFRKASCTGTREISSNTSMIIVITESKEQACGNQLTVNESHVIISNTLTIPARVLSSGIITKNNASYSFSCAFPLMMQAALLTPLHVGTNHVVVSGPDVVGDAETLLRTYADANYQIPLAASETFTVDGSLNVTVV